MIDILCMILSVIKLFIFIMAFHFKSIKRTINLTERKTEDGQIDSCTYRLKKKKKKKKKGKNQRTEGPESRTDGETLIFWD